jgi:predicted DsbA family dithiol-disulfide isomerase
MRYFFSFSILIFISLLFSVGAGYGAVEWHVEQNLKIGDAPADISMSNNGEWVYVLTETGDIKIYASDGRLEDTIHVGKKINHLAAGPSEDILLLGNREDKTVQTLFLEFVRNIDISGAAVLGLEKAPIIIVVFMDYQCPYCARLEPILEKVQESNPDYVKVVFKNFPLKMHNAANSAAEASIVAEEMGKFLEFHKQMVEGYKTLSDDKILDIASGLGFNKDDFKEKMSSEAVLKQVQKDIADGEKAGVSGTPSVFVNGRELKNRSLEGFQELIDKEIKKLGQSNGAAPKP